MTVSNLHYLQGQIAASLGVARHFDPSTDLARRVEFLVSALRHSGQRALILGISGGVDSLTAGRLCQRAVEQARATGVDATFWAMRLPYGQQHDAADAEAALAFIQPDRTLRVDIKVAVDATMRALVDADFECPDASTTDFTAGNVRARQRMIAQYAVANAVHGLVVGTDHAAEAVMGFFTKHGDGACDVVPLAGLTKRRVRAIATALGAPRHLIEKIPTADLEALRPMQPDEAVLGVRYEAIDDFLEGRSVAAADADRIVEAFQRTKHKRSGPLIPPTG